MNEKREKPDRESAIINMNNSHSILPQQFSFNPPSTLNFQSQIHPLFSDFHFNFRMVFGKRKIQELEYESEREVEVEHNIEEEDDTHEIEEISDQRTASSSPVPPSMRQKQVDTKPLYKEVTLIGAAEGKNPGGAKKWGCNHCKKRLYTSYKSPFAQRVWITRNYKGLQDKIKLVPLNLQNRPAWYKEKLYPPNKVPALEHNNKVIGESLDLIEYVDSNFEGPSLHPNDPSKREFGEELLSYSDGFNAKVYKACKTVDPAAEVGPEFDYLENALAKFDDGPFFLGQFSLVDVAYAPFIERFQNYFSGLFNYDITAGRPKLAAWIEELNKIEPYNVTKMDPKEQLEFLKARFGEQK